MKWKTPVLTERRIRRRFAWFPVELDTGYTVWLESYWRTEEFKDTKSGQGWCLSFCAATRRLEE